MDIEIVVGPLVKNVRLINTMKRPLGNFKEETSGVATRKKPPRGYKKPNVGGYSANDNEIEDNIFKSLFQQFTQLTVTRKKANRTNVKKPRLK